MTPQQTLMLKDLTSEQRTMFMMSYKEKETGTAYLFWFLLGAHFAFLGKWGTQIIYWVTLGGFGLWAIICLFTMKSIVGRANEDEFNKKLAEIKVLA